MTTVNWTLVQAALFVTSSPQHFSVFGLLVQREYEFIERRENQMFPKCHLTVHNKTESKTRENLSYATNISLSFWNDLLDSCVALGPRLCSSQ